jgi:hypothetical protein
VCWCAPPTGATSSACLTQVVHVVRLSVYDVSVHVTHFAVVCIVVHHSLVPSSSACRQHLCMLVILASLMHWCCLS